MDGNVKRLKAVTKPAFFDASHSAIKAFRSNVESRPWIRDEAVDRHLLAEHIALALFLLMFHFRWRHAHGFVDVIEKPSDPRFGVWFTRLTRNLECWHEAVALLLKDADSLGVESSVLDEEFYLVGEALKVAGPDNCIDLVAFTDAFRNCILTSRLKAAERRNLQRVGTLARTSHPDSSMTARSPCRARTGRSKSSRRSRGLGGDDAAL